MIVTGQRTRPAEPFKIIEANKAADAAVAERHLLRSLLRRCDSVLRDVALEARIAGDVDRVAEDLIRDIALAME